MAEQPGLGFAELLRQLRAEARLTQEELAEAAGLSPRSVSDLERGIHQTARKDTAGLLAGALGLAEPVRAAFVAAARGRAPVAEVLTAMRAEAAAAVPGGAMPPGAGGPPSGARGVVPRQLPAGAAFFAGREAELKQLDALLGQAAGGGPDEPAGAVVISAVAGMAGVGKTALAVHWARNVAARFPDGQLYVNLRGYDAEGAAVTPEEVTGWFLTALGVPASQIPADAPARCGLYRSVLAGQRVLIVLDNARDAAQVRPLLPGSGGCLVVVTSRSALAGLAAAEGARPLRLGPLAEEEGVQLLAARLGPERVAAEPGAVAELAARCGYLPLALAVMAARAAADPGLPLGVLAGQLDGAAGAEATAAGAGPGRLEVLETGDPATSLRQLLSWSYGQLGPSAAGMFALLGVHCGPDITVPAAASLAAVPRAAAGRALAELAGASLVAEHRLGRYVMHDLVRGYAAGQARQVLGGAGIRAAIERSLDHYLHTVIRPLPPFAVAPSAPGVAPSSWPMMRRCRTGAGLSTRSCSRPAQAAAGGLHHPCLATSTARPCRGRTGVLGRHRAIGQAALDAAEAAQDQGRGAGPTWPSAGASRHRAATSIWPGPWTASAGPPTCPARPGRPGRQPGDLRERRLGRGGYAARAGLALFRQIADQAGQGRALAGLVKPRSPGEVLAARGYAWQAREAAPPPATRLCRPWRGTRWASRTRLVQPRQAMAATERAWPWSAELKNPFARATLASMPTESGDACQAAGDLLAGVEAWRQARRSSTTWAGRTCSQLPRGSSRPARPAAGPIIRLLSGQRRPPMVNELTLHEIDKTW